MPRARWRPGQNAGSRVIQISSSGLSGSAFATFVAAILALTTAIRPRPWFDQRAVNASVDRGAPCPLAEVVAGCRNRRCWRSAP